MKRIAILVLALALAGAVGAARQPSPALLALVNARIVPVSSAPIERGTLIITGERITAMGPQVAVPSGALRIDCTGLSVYPGMIELQTSVGLAEIGQVPVTRDTTDIGEFHPQLVAVNAFNVESAHIGVTREGGVTTVLSCPSGNLIAGQATLFDLHGWTTRSMVVRERGALIVEWPRAGGFGRFGGGGAEGGNPSARIESLRRFFTDAKNYRPGSDRPNLAYEAMQPYLRGELPVILRASREADLKAAIAFAEQFGLEAVLAGAHEAPKIASLLAEKRIGVIYGGLFSLPFENSDPYDTIFAGPAALQRAGVKFAITTGGDTANARNLPFHAAAAVAFGLDEEAALRAITLTPAELMGIERDYGSLAVGKVANCFVATGSPLDARTQIRAVIIRGEIVREPSRHEQLYRKYLERLTGASAGAGR